MIKDQMIVLKYLRRDKTENISNRKGELAKLRAKWKAWALLSLDSVTLGTSTATSIVDTANDARNYVIIDSNVANNIDDEIDDFSINDDNEVTGEFTIRCMTPCARQTLNNIFSFFAKMCLLIFSHATVIKRAKKTR